MLISHKSLSRTLLDGGSGEGSGPLVMLTREAEGPLPPILLRPKISKEFTPSLKETSAAQVIKQSNETASMGPVLLILIAMLVFLDFVPNRVMVDLSVNMG